MKKIEENTTIDKKDLKEIKIELLDYAKERINIEVENTLKKVEKRLVRRKNIKIIKRDIIIILLLALCCFLSYELYDTGFFNKYFVKEALIKEDDDKNKIEKPQEDIIKEDLKEKHKNALNNISIKKTSKYLNEYYSGNLTNELKLELTLNLIPLDKIEIDEDTFIISNIIMKEYFNNLFNSSYKASSFTYGSNKIKYLKNQEVYLTNNEIKKSDNKIKRIFTDVQENNDEVIINTVEYIVDNDKVINILTKEEVLESENDVLKNQDKLNKMEYYLTFKDGAYKLANIKEID